MKQIGVIIRQTRKKATIRVKRPTSCGENCAHCSGCPTTDQLVVAANPINAPRGAVVEIETPDKMVFFAAFLVYVLPIVFLVLGYVLSGFLTSNSVLRALVAFAFLFVFFLLLRKKDAKLLKKGQYGITVTRIIHDGTESATDKE